jgi:hypothetical protein
MNPPQYLERDTIEVTNMPFDHKNAGTTWKKKYGITEPPLLANGADGQTYDDKRLKGIFKYGKYNKIVGRGYTVFPNEEAREMLQEYIKRTNSDLKITKEYTSHHGDAMFWQVLSGNVQEVKKGDDVQIGCIIRNSVGTYVALGADLFTYRLICKNGAIAKGQDLGSIAIRHIGDKDKMMLAFGKGIEHILERTEDLIKYYREAAKMKVNKLIAEKWAQRIPQRTLPKEIEVDAKTGKVTLTGAPNLWAAFNDITANSWHDYKQGEPMKTGTGFLTKYHTTLHAHKIMIQAIDGTLGKSQKEQTIQVRKPYDLR